MSAPRCPISPAFVGIFTHLHTLEFTFVHAVSLVNHWSATIAEDIQVVVGLNTEGQLYLRGLLGQRERNVNVAMEMSPTAGDKSVRAQSIRARLAVGELVVPIHAE